MDKANLAEAVNGHIDNKVITPKVLRQWGDKVGAVSVVGKASKNLFNYQTVPTQTLNGITFTNNGDGTFTLNGTATSGIWLQFKSMGNLDLTKTYTISGCPSGGSTKTYGFYFEVYNASGGWVKGAYDTGNGATLVGSSTYKSFILQFVVAKDVSFNNVTFRPMLEKGSTITPYEEYYEPKISIRDSKGAYHEVPYVVGKASKNLFDMLDSSHFKYRNKGASPYYQSFKLSSYSSNEIKVTGGNGNYTEGFIDVSGLKPNTLYRISYTIKENTLGFNPGMWINGNSSDTGTLTINIGLNNGSTNASSSNYVIFTNIQLEEGAVITPYEEPFEPKLSIITSNGTFREVNLDYEDLSSNITAGENIGINYVEVRRFGKVVSIVASITPTASIEPYAIILNGFPNHNRSAYTIACNVTDNATAGGVYLYANMLQTRASMASGKNYRFTLTYIVD